MSDKTEGMLRAFFTGGSVMFLLWFFFDEIPEAVGTTMIMGIGSVSAVLYAMWTDRKNAE
jgi:hypothetical protein|tara:strand:+ start:154 stop:333 length:180 start_codon:yes stop_codon:yes gene_type:complete